MTTHVAPSRASASPIPLETPRRIEPCLPEPNRANEMLARTLLSEVAGIGKGLHRDVVLEAADAVRLIEARYSWMLSDRYIGLPELERDLREFDRGSVALSTFPDQVHLVLAMRAMDQTPTSDIEPYEEQMIASLHTAVFADSRGFRTSPADDVPVGRHLPQSSLAIGAFLDRLSEAYAFDRMAESQQLTAIAAAHHRFTLVQPFVSGNRRIGRLLSRAAQTKCGAGGRGLWSLSRALARSGIDAYSAMLDQASTPRRADTDGRGNLSHTALREFVGWFLETAIAEVRVASEALSECLLQQRYRRAMQMAGFDADAIGIAMNTFMLGAFRADTNRYHAIEDQTAIEALTNRGFLKPLRGRPDHIGVGFPAEALPTILPGLA